MEMYIIVLAILMGGFGIMLFVAEILYNILCYIIRKLDERNNANGKL